MASERRTTQPGQKSQGMTFKNLLSDATGKSFEDITENDVENWAYANEWRDKDIRRIVKGFTKFRKKGADFRMAGKEGFTVDGANMSGRRTGNKAGFDIGDVFGLGRDVSLLGGALSQQNQSTDVLGRLDIPTKPESSIQSLPTIPNLPTTQVKGVSGQGGTQAVGQKNQQVQKDRSPKSAIVPESQGDVIDDLSQLSTDPLLAQDFELSTPLPSLMIGDRSINPDLGVTGNEVSIDIDARATELYEKANDPDTTPTQRAAIDKQITKLYLESKKEPVKKEKKATRDKRNPVGKYQKGLLTQINNARRHAYGSSKDSPANQLVNKLQADYERIYGIKIK